MLRRPYGFAAFALCAVSLAAGAEVLRAQAARGAIWIGRTHEMETHLASARVVRMEGTSVGVTRPSKAVLEPGGPFDEMLWKPLAPGRYRGYFESYRSEIAAYEIDKLLELNMVPPCVERTIDGKVGAAVMWVAGSRSFGELGGAPRPPSGVLAAWNRQIVRAKMFDNLIGNEDPNLGNWLLDADWNVILIDHSRAFSSGRKLTHEMTRIHEDLWRRITALSPDALAASPAGRWLEAGQMRAIFERRTAMQKVVDDLVRRRGAAAWYVP